MGNQYIESLELRQLLSATAVGSIGLVTMTENSSPTTISLSDKFDDPSIAGTLVHFDTSVGSFNVQLEDALAPRTVANFLHYLNAGRYRNTFVHNVTPGSTLQAGGYVLNTANGPAKAITPFAPIANEPSISNTRGTIAMAKLAGQPNSATDEFFFNLADNSATLDHQNGGYTVFGHVLDADMSVLDSIAAMPLSNLGGIFKSVPVGGTDGETLDNRLVIFNNISVISKLTYTVVDNSNPGLVSPAIVNGNELKLIALSDEQGEANITVRATAMDGTTADQTVFLNVTPPRASISGAAIPEGATGTTPLLFTVTLGSPSGSLASLDYTTVDGTATTANSDYVATSGTLIFNPGDTSKSITVLVLGDTQAEPDETFSVKLSNPINCSFTNDQATGTIMNDDPGGQVFISVGSGTIKQTDKSVTVTLSRRSYSGPATVHYATVDGTAKAGSDYKRTVGDATFAADQAELNLTIPLLNDHQASQNATFSVVLSAPTNGALLMPLGQADITIVNTTPDHVPPVAKVGTLAAPVAGKTPYVFSVTYIDNVLVNASTVKGGNILVLGPNGYNKTATLLSKSSSDDGTRITARYQVPSPSAGWAKATNGAYALWIQGQQVRDSAGNYIAKHVVGTLKVSLGTKTRPLSAQSRTLAVSSIAASPSNPAIPLASQMKWPISPFSDQASSSVWYEDNRPDA